MDGVTKRRMDGLTDVEFEINSILDIVLGRMTLQYLLNRNK